LRIAAANLVADPHTTVPAYEARLRAEDRLAELEVDGDPHASVGAAFGLSYAALPARAGRLFRLLGLAPGPDLPGAAAAALAGIPPEHAARLLRRLSGAHLLDEPTAGRYALHDLLRLYAADRANGEERPAARQAALGRLFDHYLHAVDAAASRLYPEVLRLPPPEARTGGPSAVSFDDHLQALAWLDAERANLVAAITHTATHGPRQVAWRLADALRGYLYLGMDTVDWHTVATNGLAAAQADGDRRAQAAAHLSLAGLHSVQARYQQATDHYTPALALARQTGWAQGESAALGNLGVLHWRLGHVRQAADHHTRALAIDRRTGRIASQAVSPSATSAWPRARWAAWSWPPTTTREPSPSTGGSGPAAARPPRWPTSARSTTCWAGRGTRWPASRRPSPSPARSETSSPRRTRCASWQPCTATAATTPRRLSWPRWRWTAPLASATTGTGPRR
jgi:tetratricopeptide (TPR) repeat protein